MTDIDELREISGDLRVRVFRRTLGDLEEFTGMQVDAYAILTQSSVLLCDTLLCPEDMRTVLDLLKDELKGRPLLVINSHADWDHCWGNAYFKTEPSIPLLAHERCRQQILSPQADQELKTYQQRSPLFQTVHLTPPTLTFRESLTIYGGDLTLQIFAAPGHSHDHSALWIPELRLLLAFDAVEKPIPWLADAESFPAMLQTLQYFLDLRPARVLCSHGNSTEVETVTANLTYLRRVEQKCRTFLLSSPSLPESTTSWAQRIEYPLAEAIAESMVSHEVSSLDFYHQAHEQNVTCILQWLQQQAASI